jgi:hypothetical protein
VSAEVEGVDAVVHQTALETDVLDAEEGKKS